MSWENDPVVSAPGNGGGNAPWQNDPVVSNESHPAHNFMAGVNTAIADTLGAPVDVVNWAMHHNPVGMALNAASRALGYGDIDKTEAATQAHQQTVPFGGSESIKRGMGYIGANPDNVPVNTDADRYARAAGMGAAMVAAPEFAAREAPSLAASLSGAGRGAISGAAGGLTGQAAYDAAPDPYKPIASLAGNILGGGVGTLATAPRLAAGIGRDAVAPFTEAGANRLAGERLYNSADDPQATITALSQDGQLVPGSVPTTFQQSGDMGLGSLERATQTKFPKEFQQRRADQNNARVAQLQVMQPSGEPMDLGDYIRKQMVWLDHESEKDVGNAIRVAQQRGMSLGGNASPEEYGSAMRGHLQQAEDVTRQRERALWQAIDPEGTLTLSGGPIRSTADDIVRSIGNTTKPLSDEEQKIFTAAQNLGPQTPFQDVRELRSWVNGAMRQELELVGESPAYRRLSRLRGSIESAITGAAEQQAQMVAQVGGSDALTAWAHGFENARNQWTAARPHLEKLAGGYDAGGPSGVPTARGTQGPGGSGPNDVAGAERIPATPFDAAARARLAAATHATRQRADIYNRGAVGQVLAKAGRQDLYKLSDASVPAKVFQPGPKGAEGVQSFRDAVGDHQALLTLQDYAASSLRRAAMREDGTLDPSKASAWLQRHSDALRSFPDLQARFQNATAASQAVGDAMAARRAALDAYQTGALAKVANINNSDDMTRTIGGILNSQNRVQQMEQLASTARRDPSAKAGLRKAVADYIQNKFISNTEAATSGQGLVKSDQFQTFMRTSEPALRSVFSQEEINSLKAIAADLQQANRSLTAVKIPGQSNTAQDLTALSRGKPSVLRRLATEAGGAVIGQASTVHSPILGWLGAKVVTAMRDVGMKRVDEVVRDAMLNPDLSRALLVKATGERASPSFTNRLVKALRRNTVANASLGLIASKGDTGQTLLMMPPPMSSAQPTPIPSLLPTQQQQPTGGLLPVQ